MSIYFPKNNWEPFAFERLNKIIHEHKKTGSTPRREQDFVVFDFDNTSAILDIEDNLMMYMLDNLLYKLTPGQFYSSLTTGPYDYDYQFFPDDRPEITPRHLADDIIEAYEWLFRYYIEPADKSRDKLTIVRQSPQFLTFSAKLRMYYNTFNAAFSRIPGENWSTYWFEGYTQREFNDLVSEMVMHALKQPITNRIWTSDPDHPGKTGVIRATFETGLAFPNEMLDLYRAFQANNIATYVISASPIDLVRTTVLNFGYNVPHDQIIGMCYTFDSEGRIQAVTEPDTYITKKRGKVDAIKNLIMPYHDWKEPLAVFGDSTGDYEMMTDFTTTKLAVLINRYMDNATQNIVEQAIAQYGQPDAKFILQGRDENEGQLRPYQSTIPLGHSEPVLKASDFQAQRSLSE